MYPPKTKRNKKIIELKDEGLSFSKIGKRFRIRKQTVHEIYHREKTRDLIANSGLSTRQP